MVAFATGVFAVDDSWLWVEHLAWIAEITIGVLAVGAPLAAYVLYRIFRPTFEFGFGPTEPLKDLYTARLTLTRNATAIWEAGASLSAPIRVEVAYINQGVYTAKDVTFSIFMPHDLTDVHIATESPHQLFFNHNEQCFVWTTLEESLTRGALVRADFTLRLPRGITGILRFPMRCQRELPAVEVFFQAPQLRILELHVDQGKDAWQVTESS